MQLLNIPKPIFDKMLTQARTAAPIEACGILSGTAQSVKSFFPMTNADNSSDHFSLLPQEQFAVIKQIRAVQEEMLAVYHSHPETPARPSQEDLRLAVDPKILYLILSLADDAPVLKGFIIETQQIITEVKVCINLSTKS